MKYLLDYIRGDTSLSRFAQLIEEVGLADVLNGLGAYTVFAPNNAAFEQAPEDILAQHLRDDTAKKGLVLNHICIGQYTDAELFAEDQLRSAGGGALKLNDDYGVVRISGARLLGVGLEAGNGILFAIDRLIWPSSSRL